MIKSALKICIWDLGADMYNYYDDKIIASFFIQNVLFFQVCMS